MFIGLPCASAYRAHQLTVRIDLPCASAYRAHRLTVRIGFGVDIVFLISAIRMVLASVVAFAASSSQVVNHQFETLSFKAKSRDFRRRCYRNYNYPYRYVISLPPVTRNLCVKCISAVLFMSQSALSSVAFAFRNTSSSLMTHCHCRICPLLREQLQPVSWGGAICLSQVG